jgi:hypothetical protein
VILRRAHPRSKGSLGAGLPDEGLLLTGTTNDPHSEVHLGMAAGNKPPTTDCTARKAHFCVFECGGVHRDQRDMARRPSRSQFNSVVSAYVVQSLTIDAGVTKDSCYWTVTNSNILTHKQQNMCFGLPYRIAAATSNVSYIQAVGVNNTSPVPPAVLTAITSVLSLRFYQGTDLPLQALRGP